MQIPLDEVVQLPDITTHHPSTGAVTDADSTPTFSVFEDATDTPILADQNFTKRTSLTGNYRGSITLSAANGFEVGKYYNVIATAIVNSITAKQRILHFRVTAAANKGYMDGTDFMPVDAHKPNFSVSGTTLTVKKPDGSTTAYTKTVTTDAAAEPITGAS